MATGCLDSNQNECSCNDADCSYGPCGDVTTANSQTGNNACLDSSQNPIVCTDPSCTYGDCLNPAGKTAAATGAIAATASGGSGPSLASTIASLASIGAATYAATQPTPTSTLKVGGLNLAAPIGTTTLVIAGIVVIAAIFLFAKK